MNEIIENVIIENMVYEVREYKRYYLLMLLKIYQVETKIINEFKERFYLSEIYIFIK